MDAEIERLRQEARGVLDFVIEHIPDEEMRVSFLARFPILNAWWNSLFKNGPVESTLVATL